MALHPRLAALPRLLLAEALLAAVALVLGVVPLAVFYWTPLTVPRGFENGWFVPLLALGALWVTLLVHAAVDAVRVARRVVADDGLGAGPDPVALGCRLVATLGAVAAPALPVVLFGGRGPLPQAGGAIVIVGVVAAPLLVSSVAVLLHAGWLVRSAGEGRRVTG